MGNVELHKDLSKDHTTTKGGGWWHSDPINKKIWLYSDSHDFGVAKKEDIESVLKSGRLPERLKEYEFYFSPSNKIEEAVTNGILLNNK